MAGKAGIIRLVSEQAGITQREAGAALDAIAGYVAASCQRGERCVLPGLGSFSVSDRKARQGHNPRTKEKIHIPARKGVRFKAGKDLRELLNKPKKKAKK